MSDVRPSGSVAILWDDYARATGHESQPVRLLPLRPAEHERSITVILNSRNGNRSCGSSRTRELIDGLGES